MLGRDILVCPVITKGTFKKSVTFPEGDWIDSDGIIYTGGRVKELDAPLEKLLWFRRIK
jgi:alpha-glucosidase (family GH31 glycosyl hydrolase)